MRISNSKTGHLAILVISLLSLAACNSQSIKSEASCPQDRVTEFAPASIASLINPLERSSQNVSAGERLYESKAEPVACIECHGNKGDGNGRMAHMFEPAPRNFTCKQTVDNISDGQIFWVIKHGSVGTSMPAFGSLSDEEIWQLTMYVRQFANQN